MMFLRSFARPVLLAWLLVFALILAGPASVYARVEMLNGRDGVEGDPGDGVEGIGNSSGGGTFDGKMPPASDRTFDNRVAYVELAFIYLPGYGLVLRIEPAFFNIFESWGGGK